MISSWSLTAEALRTWGDEVLVPAIEATQAEDAPLVPGDAQCQWCPVRGVHRDFTCPARARWVLESDPSPEEDLSALFDAPVSDLRAHYEGFLQPVDADRLLQFLERVEVLAADLRHALYQAAASGVDLPGRKLVRGRPGNRSWTDAARVALYASKSLRLRKGVIYKDVLRTPAQIQREVDAGTWRKLEKFVTRPDGKLMLVRADDKRPAVEVDNIFSEDSSND